MKMLKILFEEIMSQGHASAATIGQMYLTHG